MSSDKAQTKVYDRADLRSQGLRLLGFKDFGKQRRVRAILPVQRGGLDERRASLKINAEPRGLLALAGWAPRPVDR
jgi:hypothetical protein